MILETERIYLRPWQEDDAKELYKYASNPNVGLNAGWPVHTSVENSKEVIKFVLSKPNTFAVVLKDTGKVVGSIGLMIGSQSNIGLKDTEAEIGYWIGEPFWGQGLIPEAAKVVIDYGFNELKLDKIWCGVFVENTKSKRVEEKLGFNYQYTRENMPCAIEGVLHTVEISSINKNEWLSKR